MMSGGTPSGGGSSSLSRLLAPVTLGLGLGLLSWWKFSLLTVKIGHRAVVLDRFTGVAHTLDAGTHFLLPGRYTRFLIDVRIRPLTISCQPITNDLQKLDIKIRLLFRPDTSELPSFLRFFGLNYPLEFLPFMACEALNAVVARYRAEDLLFGRPDFVHRLKQELIDKAKIYFITIDDVSVIKLGFSREFINAVNRKLIAQEELDTALLRAENVAQAAIIPAGGVTCGGSFRVDFGISSSTSPSLLTMFVLKFLALLLSLGVIQYICIDGKWRDHPVAVVFGVHGLVNPNEYFAACLYTSGWGGMFCRRWKVVKKTSGISCCWKSKIDEKTLEELHHHRHQKKTHYELLGVSYDSTSQQIKDAYRKLQKMYHPDVAGPKGHDYTLLLNEAYKVLMSQELRKEYDVSIFRHGKWYGRDSSSFSSWNGPLRPEALFVDQNHCIGCRECVHYANNTFTMDETKGCARVKVQYGDDLMDIQVSVDSCPVNCIHWVNEDELQILEYLTQPQPKEGHGIYGQGWERPANIFAAAEAFKKKLNHQKEG
ncbi:OLC1v1011719C1 [Oldenlandia corymbosa var. corymbosa]|uniref:OLC1v1011719C1 n=1 Tax=Oldenlandia corymbosa var. corymbosa TaxID=529605 RepID=A0AAV1DUD0_OLDCO|nr:OLC1v1011719C1 [Oldenlandia corymbosa var. corymbosa]